MVGPLGRGEEGAALITEALHHMRLALDLVDRAHAPADIGAYLDLAIVKLQDALPGRSKSNGHSV